MNKEELDFKLRQINNENKTPMLKYVEILNVSPRAIKNLRIINDHMYFIYTVNGEKRNAYIELNRIIDIEGI